jgi:hypothetical protein
VKSPVPAASIVDVPVPAPRLNTEFTSPPDESVPRFSVADVCAIAESVPMLKVGFVETTAVSKVRFPPDSVDTLFESPTKN